MRATRHDRVTHTKGFGFAPETRGFLGLCNTTAGVRWMRRCMYDQWDRNGLPWSYPSETFPTRLQESLAERKRSERGAGGRAGGPALGPAGLAPPRPRSIRPCAGAWVPAWTPRRRGACSNPSWAPQLCLGWDVLVLELAAAVRFLRPLDCAPCYLLMDPNYS